MRMAPTNQSCGNIKCVKNERFRFTCPANSRTDALPRARDAGLRHDFVFAHEGFSRVVSAPASTTIVYVPGAGRQCCPRPGPQHRVSYPVPVLDPSSHQGV